MDNRVLHGARYLVDTMMALPVFQSWSVATGMAGIALTFKLVDAGCEGEWNWYAERCLAQALTLQARVPIDRMDGGLFTGLTGLCRVLSVFANMHASYLPLKSWFDSQLLTWIQRTYSVACEQSGHPEVSFHAYDVISGPAGILSYVLDMRGENPSQAQSTALDRLLDHLLVLCCAHEDHADHLRFFIVPERAPYPAFARRYPAGATDCGFAHGVAGVLAVLSLCLLRQVRRDDLFSVVGQLAEWLLSHRVMRDDGLVWPSLVPEQKAILAGDTVWCYGASGTAWSLWLAGCACQNEQWQALAVQAMEAVFAHLKRVCTARSFLCHGIAGILQIVEGFLHMSSDRLFPQMKADLLAQLLLFYDPDLPSGFWSSRSPEAEPLQSGALLEGVAGLILTLAQEQLLSFRALAPFFLLTDVSTLSLVRHFHEDGSEGGRR